MINQKNDYTKSRFADALKNYLTHNSPESATVQKIASLSGCSRRTFYNYFQDIDDLIVWIFQKDVLSLVPNHTSDTYQQFITKEINQMSRKDVERFLAERQNYLRKNHVFYRKALLMSGPNSLWNFMLKATKDCYIEFLNILMEKNHFHLDIGVVDRIADYFSYISLRDIYFNDKDVTNKENPYSIYNEFNDISFGRRCIIAYLEKYYEIKIADTGWI